MADFVFNISKGRGVELFDRVDSNDPTNSGLVMVAINTSASDATLIDLDTLSAVLADGNTAEVTNVGYSRIVLTDTDLPAPAPDDANDRFDVNVSADFDFGSITAGDAWTDLVLCYDPDTTGGTDADLIPIAQYDFPITPDGSNITAERDAAGLLRAA